MSLVPILAVSLERDFSSNIQVSTILCLIAHFDRIWETKLQAAQHATVNFLHVTAIIVSVHDTIYTQGQIQGEGAKGAEAPPPPLLQVNEMHNTHFGQNTSEVPLNFRKKEHAKTPKSDIIEPEATYYTPANSKNLAATQIYKH